MLQYITHKNKIHINNWIVFLGKANMPHKELSKYHESSDVHTYFYMDAQSDCNTYQVFIKENRSPCLLKPHPCIEISMWPSQSGILGKFWCLLCTNSHSSWPHTAHSSSLENSHQVGSSIAVSWAKSVCLVLTLFNSLTSGLLVPSTSVREYFEYCSGKKE